MGKLNFSVGIIVVLGAAVRVSAPKPPLTIHDKAYYLNENQINLVRRGLGIKVTAAEIAADGWIRARFRLTDPRGQALDRLGVTTPGSVSVSFLAADIPKD